MSHFIIIAGRRVSPKQAELLVRAFTGEDRIIPERFEYERDRRAAYGYRKITTRPEQRWFVPAGMVVPDGSAEYAACYALRRRGYVEPGSVGPCAELPYGQGGYVLTAAGWKASRILAM